MRLLGIVAALLRAAILFTRTGCRSRSRSAIFAIAALGLNILVGFTGQISIGHSAFFVFGAFISAYLSNKFPMPVFFAIPLAGVVTALVGLIVGVPAARLKGLYLVDRDARRAIHPARFLLARGLVLGRLGAGQRQAILDVRLYAVAATGKYFYVVLAYVLVSYVLVTNLMRTRDGRALVAIRDHYLSAEIMGINLTNYRTLSFGIAALLRRHRRRALCPLPASSSRRRASASSARSCSSP